MFIADCTTKLKSIVSSIVSSAMNMCIISYFIEMTGFFFIQSFDRQQ